MIAAKIALSDGSVTNWPNSFVFIQAQVDIDRVLASEDQHVIPLIDSLHIMKSKEE